LTFFNCYSLYVLLFPLIFYFSSATQPSKEKIFFDREFTFFFLPDSIAGFFLPPEVFLPYGAASFLFEVEESGWFEVN
jgi:hypothetical protein